MRLRSIRQIRIEQRARVAGIGEREPELCGGRMLRIAREREEARLQQDADEEREQDMSRSLQSASRSPAMPGHARRITNFASRNPRARSTPRPARAGAAAS